MVRNWIKFTPLWDLSRKIIHLEVYANGIITDGYSKVCNPRQI